VDHIGIDVHKTESQICILADGGELIERRIRTEAERFAVVLCRVSYSSGRPCSRPMAARISTTGDAATSCS
jgi:hypothetical protein